VSTDFKISDYRIDLRDTRVREQKIISSITFPTGIAYIGILNLICKNNKIWQVKHGVMKK
jgi:hypothetical protein